MDNDFINANLKLHARFIHDLQYSPMPLIMTEINYWLMKSEPIVITMDLKKPLKNVHDMFTF